MPTCIYIIVKETFTEQFNLKGTKLHCNVSNKNSYTRTCIYPTETACIFNELLR